MDSNDTQQIKCTYVLRVWCIKTKNKRNNSRIYIRFFRFTLNINNFKISYHLTKIVILFQYISTP